jgi:acyl-CoA synthetase (AMP-forming)/AMP-acid ligase II/aryl carrier-like protein
VVGVAEARDLSTPPRSLVEVLRARAEAHGDRSAFTFLVDGEREALGLSFGELDERARAIAATLAERVDPGARAVLLYPPSLEYVSAFFGCLYAGVIAVPAYPPVADRMAGRLKSLIADCDAELALTVELFAPLLDERAGQFGLTGIPVVPTDAVGRGAADAWSDPLATEDTLAFLQYSSGSTGDPKGVMVSHRNLIENSECILEHARTPDLSGVSWLPPYHDMGLIGGIVQPVYVGSPMVLMSPMAFLERPFRWLDAISRYRANGSPAPNFAYDLCVRKIGEEERASLDLSCWTIALNGAEPIRADTLDRFAIAFERCGFRREAFHPAYGLAEGTLMVAGDGRPRAPVVETLDADELQHDRATPARAGAEPSQVRSVVGCGAPVPRHEVVAVDVESGIDCDERRIGEIWVAGPSVAEGYWGNPDESARTFEATLPGRGATRFLRTGDLGFVSHGELFVTGRLKDLIVINGRNIYPQDIELTVERSAAGLRPGCGAAFGLDDGRGEGVVVVSEVDPAKSGDLGETIVAIRQAVAQEHDVRLEAVTLIDKGTIPKTSSGKIQRRACRAAFLEGALSVVERWAASSDGVVDAGSLRWSVSAEELAATAPDRRRRLLEEELRAQVADLLQLDAGAIGVDRPLTAVGLDSLAALNLKERIERGLGVSVPLSCLAESLTTSEVATLVSALSGDSSNGNHAEGIALDEAVTRDSAASLLARLDAVPDDEVDALLRDLVAGTGEAAHAG